MRALMMVVSVWSAIAIMGVGCSPRAPVRNTPAGPAAAGHVATWDAELNAVATILAKLEPGSARLEVGGIGKMSIRVVSPTTARPEDVAALDVGDTCSTNESGIICSERALSYVMIRPSAPVHPVLLFLIAHELDHLRHGELRAFAMPALPIKARSTGRAIVGAVKSSACAKPSPVETRADDFARDLVGRAVATGLFSRGDDDTGLAAVSVVNMMFEVAAQASQGGDRSTAALFDSLNAATDDEISDTAERVLCLIAPGQDHDVNWQGFPGGYQTEGVRLTRTAEKLSDELVHGKYGVAAHAGNLRALLQTSVGMQRVMMRQTADFVMGVAALVCDQMNAQANPWRDLDCHAMPPARDAGSRPPQTCPALEAHAVAGLDLSRPKPPVTAAMSVRGNELRVNAAVTTAVVRGRGDVVIAIGDRGKIVSWVTPATTTVIGEAGCEVGGIAEAGAALVAVCSHGEAVVRIEAGQRSTIHLGPVSIGGEAHTPDHVRVSWVGSVSGRVLAAVHLLGSGQGVLAQVTADGLRSVGAWTARGCDSIPFAVRVADVGGELWATPAHQAIEPQAIRLRADLGSVTEQLQPEAGRIDLAISDDPRGNIPIMSCHASAARHAQLCVAMDGRFVDARDPFGKVLGHMAPAVSFAPGTVDVRSCGTTQAEYLMVIEHGVRAQIFELPAQGARAEVRWQVALAGAADGTDLTCGGEGALFTLNSGGASIVVRLGPAVK
jgi:hypothetical protein